MFIADFAVTLLDGSKPNIKDVGKLVSLIYDLDLVFEGDNPYKGYFEGTGKLNHPDFVELKTRLNRLPKG